jgi:hypothetical protein
VCRSWFDSNGHAKAKLVVLVLIKVLLMVPGGEMFVGEASVSEPSISRLFDVVSEATAGDISTEVLVSRMLAAVVQVAPGELLVPTVAEFPVARLLLA